MRIKFRLFSLIFISVITLSALPGCQPKEAANEIKVGTISGPETELMETAKQVAKEKYNLVITIVPFTDYTMPNAALNDGSIDANMYQTIPFYAADTKAHNYQFAIVGKTFIYPMAIYSKKIKSINEVPDNSIVAIPNDPSNEARALMLLEKAGLLKLRPGADTTATPADVIENPKNLQFKELDAAQLPRVLQDVTMAIINTNFAIPANLYPTRDSIYLENKNSPYANIIVVRAADQNDPRVKKLVDALHSQEVLETANKLFKGQALPAWDNINT